MNYEAVRIGNVTVDKKDVLLFEMNGIDVENYSISEIRKLWCGPNIKLKFKNNKKVYCESADMLFIFAHDDKKKYMREFEPQEYGPYKTLNDLFDDIERFSNDVIGKIDVKKICLSDRRYSSVVFNRDREPVSVYSCLLSDDEENLAERFDLMWFVCPTPFARGDVVYAPNIARTYPPTPEVEPFVLDRLCYENADSRYFSNKYDHGDSTDMTATGYFQDDDGKIYMECMHDYLSLEYYNGRRDGKLRILKAVSKYLKGEIPLDLLLNAYDIVIKEENLSKTRRYMNFIEQDLKDIGI